MSAPSLTILKTKMIYRNLCLATNLNLATDKSQVFKWKRVEGQANYPPSLEACAS